MTERATVRNKAVALTAAGDRETYIGFIRLYILCRAGEEPISSRGISEKLAGRGLPVSTGSLTRLVRGLENHGYLKSGETGRGRQRHKVYRATRHGRLKIEQAQGKLRSLISALSQK
jgi:DNA-binding PadR family transcriptional regulator